MRSLAFGVVLFTAAATSLYAESVTPPPGAPGAAPLPPEQMVAPVAPTKVSESPAPGGGKPANICQELVTFAEDAHRRAERTRTANRPGAAGSRPRHDLAAGRSASRRRAAAKVRDGCPRAAARKCPETSIRHGGASARLLERE
jgi:hypothetical protein